MSIFKNPKNGIIQIGQLSGKVIWGDVPWKSINVNHNERFTELGWEPMETFTNFTLEKLENCSVSCLNCGVNISCL